MRAAAVKYQNELLAALDDDPRVMWG